MLPPETGGDENADCDCEDIVADSCADDGYEIGHEADDRDTGMNVPGNLGIQAICEFLTYHGVLHPVSVVITHYELCFRYNSPSPSPVLRCKQMNF